MARGPNVEGWDSPSWWELGKESEWFVLIYQHSVLYQESSSIFLFND